MHASISFMAPEGNLEAFQNINYQEIGNKIHKIFKPSTSTEKIQLGVVNLIRPVFL